MVKKWVVDIYWAVSWISDKKFLNTFWNNFEGILHHLDSTDRRVSSSIPKGKSITKSFVVKKILGTESIYLPVTEFNSLHFLSMLLMDCSIHFKNDLVKLRIEPQTNFIGEHGQLVSNVLDLFCGEKSKKLSHCCWCSVRVQPLIRD